MTKLELLKPFASAPELRHTLSRLLDKRTAAQERGIPAYSGFLSPEEQAAARDMLHRLPAGEVLFFGGFEGAERKVCAFLPDWMEPEDFLSEGQCPVWALEVQVPPMAQLSHRDYLGALMGLGLNREKLGDILLTDSGCQLLALGETIPILLDQWEKVARFPVTLRQISLEELVPKEPEGKLMRDTVASLRLDAVLAAGFSIPRSRAAELIAAGRAMRNHRPCNRTDQLVEAGDVFSCRGLGKFVLQKAEGKSRKGRIILELERYL